MRERWVDHRSRSLAVLLVVLIVAMVPAGGVQSQDKKPIVIAVPGGLSGGNSVVGPAAGQWGERAGGERNSKGGGLGRTPPVVSLDGESWPAGAATTVRTAT